MRAVHSTAVEQERYEGGVWDVHDFCETCTTSVKRARLLANVDKFYEFDDKFSNTAKSS